MAQAKLTAEDIAAAYDLIQKAELAVYQTMVDAGQEALEKIEASMKNLPANRNPMPAGLQNVMGWVGSLRSMVSTAQSQLAQAAQYAAPQPSTEGM
jgi:hypothetical protein